MSLLKPKQREHQMEFANKKSLIPNYDVNEMTGMEAAMTPCLPRYNERTDSMEIFITLEKKSPIGYEDK